MESVKFGGCCHDDLQAQLHINVFLGLDGMIRVDGWYKDENEGKESSDYLSSTTSTRCGRQTVAFSLTLAKTMTLKTRTHLKV